ncbi:DUF4259 domain-containing protein [Flaviaesturariibacter aridisoli]|uniref:DUF4259 domain-containing protein n=1 Tax=Flaviaesturariibacter aridisoli TaxID=2545761 RepID=A0A4V2WMC3_9BACT|nr:DUF4259 domain-containing protein [Flaviaesturariibacter aridisoli]TCZ67714.1 DUF4259 domain-containing protein [Flaviaesturariibacter aridisoli]
MGTWGYNYFENDAAFDYMDDIEETDDPVDMIEDIFDEATGSESLDADTGSAAIVAAAYVDRQLNGTRYSEAGDEELLPIDSFFDRNPDVDLAPYRAPAVAALRNVLGEASELRAEWSEKERDFAAWQATIEALIGRLDNAQSPLRSV